MEERNLKAHFLDIKICTMNDKELYILLQIIERGGNITKLAREGIDFFEIGILMSSAKNEGFLEYNNKKVIVTSKGENKMIELEKRFKIIDKTKWIEPENKSKISKLDKKFIYLPNQNELFF